MKLKRCIASSARPFFSQQAMIWLKAFPSGSVPVSTIFSRQAMPRRKNSRLAAM